MKQRLGAALLLSVFSVASIAACVPVRRGDHPNVLLVTVDTLRAGHLSSYGFALETSPHIDALAAESALFERAVAASSSTAPSHALILTSRSVPEHSIGHEKASLTLDVYAGFLPSNASDAAARLGKLLG